jgi:hypothetical protein
MLRRGWLLRYLPEIVLRNVPEPMIVAAGYAWAALLATLGLANLIIALHFDFATWAWFVSVGSIGTKLAAFALQYGSSGRSSASASRNRRCSEDQCGLVSAGARPPLRAPGDGAAGHDADEVCAVLGAGVDVGIETVAIKDITIPQVLA